MLKGVGPKGRSAAVRNARAQRRAMTPPELALWSALRGRPAGLKFRRQHPVGERLSLDFFCNDARLAIEVDGAAHERGDRLARDQKRDEFLRGHAIETLRIPAREILKDLDAVVTMIIEQARHRLPLHHAAHGPPPRDELGEDKEGS